MSKHDEIQCEFRVLGIPEEARAIDDSLTIRMDRFNFHGISMRVESPVLAQELADAINTVLEGHRARTPIRRAG
ncbi:hypothetical protein [Xanthobacter flavus]|uniref:hypothetical protein n=1 Tax=Xanthobacter flavus TaxID=281 RepID=UPI001AE6574E|nr:hypothetical protein [Xanthobacter flavus]MBP2147432.1 hypothetical protein [Xanthobacter flavus]